MRSANAWSTTPRHESRLLPPRHARGGAPDLDYANLGEIQDGNAAGEAYEVLADPATDPARRAALDRDLRAYCKRDTEGLMRLAGFLQGLR